MLCPKLHVLLPSPQQGWPWAGTGRFCCVLLWVQHEGLAAGARILAEAVRWSGFSCNCRGHFPVVFQPLSCSCRRSQRCHRIAGAVEGAAACPSWAAVVAEGSAWSCLRSNVSHRRCRAGCSGGYAAGWLCASGSEAFVFACHCE